ncbi:MAG TPA: SEC-C metal-binding domain-containing protein [Thermoanaerobaculia bacterium]
MQNVGRNEKCPCGSGKKFKNCHAEQSQHPAPRGLIFLGVAIAAVAAVGIVPALRSDKDERATPVSAAAPAATSTAPAATPGSPQPPGPVPPGKVWNVEHGHWHDENQAAPQNAIRIDGLPTTAPIPGAAPLAATTTSPAQSNIPQTLTPQPAGPAPAGKVWSAEHGHWHDAAPQ